MSLEIKETWVGGFEGAIHGMRNPMNSWDKSDSTFEGDIAAYIGPDDRKLAHKLFGAGTEHRKYLRFCHIQMGVTAPLYWWKEYDTYKVGTATNSCSTMHKIHAKEFTFDDFSCEHLMGGSECFNPGEVEPLSDAPVTRIMTYTGDEVWTTPKGILSYTIDMLNLCRALYLKTKDKKYWWQMIQLLPSSYNQYRDIDLNYETAATIIRHRSGHKLDEWHTFVDALKELPYMKEFMEGEAEDVEHES